MTTSPRIFQSLWWRLGSTAFFVASLLFLTDTFVAGPFRYFGYIGRSAGYAELTVAIASTAVLALTTPGRWRRASDCAYGFLVATVALPVLWIPLVYGPLTDGRVVNLQLVTVTAFTGMRLLLLGERRSLRAFVAPSHIFWAVIGSGAAASIFYLVFRVGLRFEIVGMAEVYDQRDVYSANVGAVGGYLMGWVGAGTLPVVLAVGLYRGAWKLVAFGVAGVLVLYSLTGYKSYIIGVGLVYGAYLLAKRAGRLPTDWTMWLGVAMWVAAAIDHATSSPIFTSLVVRRAVATSGTNTAFYVDFFSRYPGYGLRHSVLSFLGEPPYPWPPARLIGQTYYGSSDFAANANFLADGIANFGMAGAIGAALLLGICLRGYDVFSSRVPVPVAAPALMLVLVALANTALLTVLLTHGGFVVAAMAWLVAGQVREGANGSEVRPPEDARARSTQRQG